MDFFSVSNMALHKPAWQHSTYLDYAASRAVDGNDNTNMDAGGCSYTDSHTYPTWGVDLPVMSIIYSVEIMRRDALSHGKTLQFYHVIML